MRRITSELNGRASAVTLFASAKTAPVTLQLSTFQWKASVLVRRSLARYTLLKI